MSIRGFDILTSCPSCIAARHTGMHIENQALAPGACLRIQDEIGIKDEEDGIE